MRGKGRGGKGREGEGKGEDRDGEGRGMVGPQSYSLSPPQNYFPGTGTAHTVKNKPHQRLCSAQ